MQNTVNVTAFRWSRGQERRHQALRAHGDAGGDAGGDADAVAPSGPPSSAGAENSEPGRTGSVQATRILGQYLVLSEPLFTGRKGGIAESSTTHVL